MSPPATTGPGGGLDLVFWPVGLGERSLADHLEIAAAGGFTSLAIAPNRAKALMQQGQTAQDLIDQAGEKGLRYSWIDGVATWVAQWQAQKGDPALNAWLTAVFDIDMNEALDIGAALGTTALVAVPFFDPGSLPRDTMIEGFRTLCDRARGHGLRVDMEPIPFWGLPDLTQAWDIVSAAGCEQSGLMIDTWHIQKGSPDYARDMALLEAIPGRFLKHVQLADAALAPRADTLAGDVLFRKFPGEGELDLCRMLAIIAAKGELASVGPEIVNAEQDSMTNAQIGTRSGRTTRTVLRQAGIAVGD